MFQSHILVKINGYNEPIAFETSNAKRTRIDNPHLRRFFEILTALDFSLTARTHEIANLGVSTTAWKACALAEKRINSILPGSRPFAGTLITLSPCEYYAHVNVCCSKGIAHCVHEMLSEYCRTISEYVHIRKGYREMFGSEIDENDVYPSVMVIPNRTNRDTYIINFGTRGCHSKCNLIPGCSMCIPYKDGRYFKSDCDYNRL